jgi:hypothetical protein
MKKATVSIAAPWHHRRMPEKDIGKVPLQLVKGESGLQLPAPPPADRLGFFDVVEVNLAYSWQVADSLRLLGSRVLQQVQERFGATLGG